VRISELPDSWFAHPEARSRYTPDSEILFAEPADLERARLSIAIRPNNLQRQRPVHLALRIGRLGPGERLHLNLVSGDRDCCVELGDHVQGDWSAWLWKGGRLRIGSGSTSLGTRLMICEGGSVTIGPDAMLSETVFLQCGDGNHALVCLASGRQLNQAPPAIELAEHVWLGRNVTVVASGRRLRIGAGSVVGIGSVLARSLPAGVVAAGAPARVVRTGASWCRSPEADPAEIQRLRQLLVAAEPAAQATRPRRWLAARLRRILGHPHPAGGDSTVA
jgi:acetyltransferase-like isoleucine patch superfamily enzyme